MHFHVQYRCRARLASRRQGAGGRRPGDHPGDSCDHFVTGCARPLASGQLIGGATDLYDLLSTLLNKNQAFINTDDIRTGILKSGMPVALLGGERTHPLMDPKRPVLSTTGNEE